MTNMSLLNTFLKKKFFAELPDIFTYRHLLARVHKRAAFRLIVLWRKNKVIKKVGRVYVKVSGDPYVIATRLINGYLSFSSALYIRGLKTELEKSIYVVTGLRKQPIVFPSYQVIPVRMPGFLIGFRSIKRTMTSVLVATLPKILFDMCDNPKHADFYSLYRALNWKPLSKDEWEELLQYAKMAPLSTLRRIGYITEGKAPAWFTKTLEKRNPEKGTSFLYRAQGHYDKKWRLYDSQYVRRWIKEI